MQQQVAFTVSVVAVVIVGLAVKIGFIGVAVWFASACPDSSRRMLEAYSSQGRRAVFIGIINLFVGIFVAAALAASGALAFFGILLFIFIAVLVVLGYGIAYQHLGRRLVTTVPSDSPTLAILVGGVVAESAFLTPIVGQLLCLWLLFRGFGAVVITLLASRRVRKAKRAASAVPPVEA